MASGVGLIANLGDDELLAGAEPPRPRPTLATPARLWSLLFASTARLLPLAAGSAGAPREGEVEENDFAWPAALGPRPEAAVFDWMPAEAALVPWISTPGLWARFGADGPPIAAARPEIVARVHDKAFAHRVARGEGLLPAALRDLVTVFDPAELQDADQATARMAEVLASWPKGLARAFTLKPRLGTSGRGRVAGSAEEVDTPALRGALPRLAARGGALLEPWFARSCDLSAQLFVDPDGGVTLLGTLEQLVTPSGLFLGHRGEIDSRGRVFSGNPFEESLREAAPLVAVAAAAEGFHGPCGVDAFALRLPDADGLGADGQGADAEREILRPVVEFNARYTMGSVTIGLVRRALDPIREPLGLVPGCRRAFLFGLDAPSGGWAAAAESAGADALLLRLFNEGREVPEESARPALHFATSSDQLDEAASRFARPPR